MDRARSHVLGSIGKAVVMKISWLIVATVVPALGNAAFAPDAFACGVPGQFGGCLAHGDFDSTVHGGFAGLDRRFHRDTYAMGAITGTTRRKERAALHADNGAIARNQDQ